MIPVGLILKGASMASNLLSNIGKKSVPVPENAATVTGVKLSPGEIAATPNKETAADMYKAGLDLTKAAQPQAGGLPGLIQNIGGVAKSILSTLNDDEWFGKFNGNGAAFNELLKASEEGTDSLVQKRKKNGEIDYAPVNSKVYNILVPYAEVSVKYNDADKVVDTYMPSVIAYVRNKTNNVLTSETKDYYKAFVTSAKLLMVYYHLQKLEKLALNVPQNVPNITEVIPFIQPINITAIMGMKDALRDYIESAVRLPYALTSYLRWRFGTVFMSANTKKAGLISYVPDTTVGGNRYIITSNQILDSAGWIRRLQDLISALKYELATVGRANADLYHAYSDHEIKYDVEDRHYDEKEFCLRQNYTVTPQTSGQNVYDCFKDNVLCLDSRLDMNAAIQAVLISTRTDDVDDIVPFVVVDEALYFDFSATKPKAMELAKFNNLHEDVNQDQPEGWYELHISEIARFDDQPSPDTPDDAWVSYGDPCIIPIFNTQGLINEVLSGRNNTLAWIKGMMSSFFWNLGTTSLEMHINRSLRYVIDAGYDAEDNSVFESFLTAPLAFDYARITNASVQSIQRAAMLNLTRGDYKRKTTTNVTPEIKEVISDVTKGKVEVKD